MKYKLQIIKELNQSITTRFKTEGTGVLITSFHYHCVWSYNSVGDHISSLEETEREYSTKMAFLGISRPALVCLLLWLTLSQEARKAAKCKNPKVKINEKRKCLVHLYQGYEGDTIHEGCYQLTCVKASKKSGIWVKTPAL